VGAAVARTTNGGASWQIVRPYEDLVWFSKASAVSADCAWVGGQRRVNGVEQTFVLRTTDGGLTWSESVMGSAWIQDVQAIDSSRAYIVTGGRIWVTSDGGASWTRVFEPFEVHGIRFVNGDRGWALAGDMERSSASLRLWRTTNACRTWTEVDPFPSDVTGYSDIAFSDSEHGCVVSGRGGTATTADGGLTWTLRDEYGDEGTLVRMTDSEHVWLRKSSWIVGSDDGGVTWVPLAYDPVLYRCDFEIEGEKGWVVGDTFLRTERNGRSDMHPPVTAHDCPAFIKSPVTVALTAADQQSGVASTWYEINGQGWHKGTTFVIEPPPGVASGTKYRVEVSSQDIYGNWESGNRFDVTVDTLPPSLEMIALFAPLDEWTGNPNAIRMQSWDGADGSGVASVNVSQDGGPSVPMEANGVLQIPAPTDHSNDGIHTFTAQSVDQVGNIGEAQTHGVGIDTRKPSARAPYQATAYSRGIGAIKFRINDAQPCANACRVVITIKTLGGRKLGVLTPDVWLKANRWITVRFGCPLKPGKYRFFVKGYDPASNMTPRSARNYLIVRKRTTSGVEPHQIPGLLQLQMGAGSETGVLLRRA
jgi:photosystem II stability/assembly factor-like uncharacterized protein